MLLAVRHRLEWVIPAIFLAVLRIPGGVLKPRPAPFLGAADLHFGRRGLAHFAGGEGALPEVIDAHAGRNDIPMRLVPESGFIVEEEIFDVWKGRRQLLYPGLECVWSSCYVCIRGGISRDCFAIRALAIPRIRAELGIRFLLTPIL